MDKKYTSLRFQAQICPIEKINDEFELCKCYVQGVGKNQNMSYISKENILRNLPTLNYAPVVGHLLQKDDENGWYMGGHDFEIGTSLEPKPLTVPFGVVKKDSFGFEDVTLLGNTSEYLTAEIILWVGRYPELKQAIYDNQLYFNQSMELSVERYQTYGPDNRYIELLDWTYSALCLLGKSDNLRGMEHTQPCFMESKVIPLQYSVQQNSFMESMNQLKHELNLCFSNRKSKGNIPNRNDKEKSLSDSEATTESNSGSSSKANLNSNSVSDSDTILDSDSNSNSDTNLKSSNAAASSDDSSISSTVHTLESYLKERQALEQQLTGLSSEGITHDADIGAEVTQSQYYLVDFDEINLYAVRYTFSEEKQLEKTYGQFTRMKGDSPKDSISLDSFVPLTLIWNPYDDAMKEEKSSIFTKFDQLLGASAEYQALKEHPLVLSPQDLQEKCFSLIGRMITGEASGYHSKSIHTSSKKETLVKIPYEIYQSKEDEYGGILSTYCRGNE